MSVYVAEFNSQRVCYVVPILKQYVFIVNCQTDVIQARVKP